jgi:hypothetical protein
MTREPWQTVPGIVHPSMPARWRDWQDQDSPSSRIEVEEPPDRPDPCEYDDLGRAA